MDFMQLRKFAGQTADKYIGHIRDAQWEQPSTCSEWTVRQLLNHLVNENYWEPELLQGKKIKDVGNKYDGDLLGEAPIVVWQKTLASADEFLEANPNVIDHVCHLSYGDVACHEYISQRILDLTIHGWDIAKSTGQDTTLPPELVTFLWETFSRESMIRESGLFGKQIPVPETADAQTKLLAFLGRQ